MAVVRHFADMSTRKLKISSIYIIEAIHNKDSLTGSAGNSCQHVLIMTYFILERSSGRFSTDTTLSQFRPHEWECTFLTQSVVN